MRQALFTQACYFNSDFMSYDGDAKLQFYLMMMLLCQNVPKPALELLL